MPLRPNEGRLKAARGAPPRRARVLIRRADSLAPKRLCFGTEGIQTICVLALEAPKRLCFGTLEAPKRLCMGALEACTRFWAPWKHPNDCVWAPWKHPRLCLGALEAPKRLCLGALEAPKRSLGSAKRLCLGLPNDCVWGCQTIVSGRPRSTQTIQESRTLERSLGSQAIVFAW